MQKPNRRDLLKAGLGAPLTASPRPVEKPLPEAARQRLQSRMRLMECALGKLPADVVITNGRLLSTLTGEILPDQGVAMYGKRIAAVGNISRQIGPRTHVIDAQGRYLSPGFVDAHYHCESSRLSATQHAALTLPMGLTAYFEGTHELTNAASGLPGVDYFLNEGASLPQKIYPCTSSATPPSPMETTSGYIGYWETLESFRRGGDRIRGVDEVMDLPRVTGEFPRLQGVMQAALDSGRMVAGHGSPPLEVLDGWIAAGIANSHSSRIAEALTMLRKGVHLELKTERSAEIIKQFLAVPIQDWRNVGLSVDDRSAWDLYQRGGLNYEVRTAIEMGVPAITAYQMATINNAAHWHVEQHHGVLAPGRYADVLVISDLEKVTIDQVFADGMSVASQGRLTKSFAIPAIPQSCLHRVRLKRPLRTSDFRIVAPSGITEVKTYVTHPRNTDPNAENMIRTMPVKDGAVQRDLSRGITKLAIVERYRLTGNIGVSLWELGFREGAVAWTINHDHHNLAVIGATDEDMAIAANRCAELNGGYAVVNNGKVLAELSLPIGGLMTHEDPGSVAGKLEQLDRALSGFGPAKIIAEHPSDKITFMNLTCDPYTYALTDLGLFQLKTGRKLPIVLA